MSTVFSRGVRRLSETAVGGAHRERLLHNTTRRCGQFAGSHFLPFRGSKPGGGEYKAVFGTHCGLMPTPPALHTREGERLRDSLERGSPTGLKMQQQSSKKT